MIKKMLLLLLSTNLVWIPTSTWPFQDEGLKTKNFIRWKVLTKIPNPAVVMGKKTKGPKRTEYVSGVQNCTQLKSLKDKKKHFRKKKKKKLLFSFGKSNKAATKNF